MITAVSTSTPTQVKLRIEVKEKSSGRAVEAWIVLDLTLAQMRATEALWAPLREAVSKAWKPEDKELPEDLNWNWYHKKLTYRPHSVRVVGIEVNGAFEGLMMTSKLQVASRSPGASNTGMLYVEFLETSPRNQEAFVGKDAVYGKVGTHLILAAISMSAEMGLGGRLALHSLSSAKTFYSGLGFEDLGFDKQEGCQYYELTDAGVKKLLGDRNEVTEAKP